MTEFDERVWYQIFRCPKCGYKTHVTDVCRTCSATEATDLAIRPVWCEKHKTYHFSDRNIKDSGEAMIYHRKGGKPTMHQNIRMVPTEMATRYNPNLQKQERRKIKNLPKDAIIR